MAIAILRVSQLNRYLRSLLEGDSRMHEVYLRGEIANFAKYPSGHLYFSLREGDVSIRAVMFRGNAQYIRFIPENGMQVLVHGTVSVYERDGSCQLIASDIVPAGAGERAVALEQLKQKLLTEGLFDTARKRPLPPHPRVLGVVTSQKGAVIHDIESVVFRKAPDVHILLAGASVQGNSAAEELRAAIDALNSDGRSDVIIIARGGGSAENLDVFSDEALVRTVALSRIPVISAVGHETDTTLCDLASDCRAATPTAAAEIVLGSIGDMPERLAARLIALRSVMGDVMTIFSDSLDERRKHFAALSPQSAIINKQNELTKYREILERLSQAELSRHSDAIARRAENLEHLSPLGILTRGYSITRRNGEALRTITGVKIGDMIETRLADGYITSVVTGTLKEDTP